jgi:hypothetical protein
LYLEGKLIPSRKKKEKGKKRKKKEHFLQQDKGALWFIKGSLILSASDTECF